MHFFIQAMYFFVVMCCGCAMVTLHSNDPNVMQVAASFGFGIMVIAHIVGPLSGGHINCAVSFALYLGGRVSLVRFICYTFSQLFGSFFGALSLWAIFGANWQGGARAFGANSWDTDVFDGGKVFFAEAIGTALLVLTVFATIDIPTQGGGALGVFPIAMSVTVSHLFLVPIDGCSINPTRSFGPSLVAYMARIGGTYQSQQYMFWFAPMSGAMVAALAYEYGGLKPRKRGGAHGLAEELWGANVARKNVASSDNEGGDFAKIEDEGNENDNIPLTNKEV